MRKPVLLKQFDDLWKRKNTKQHRVLIPGADCCDHLDLQGPSYLFLWLWKVTVPPLMIPSFRSSLSFQFINLLRLWSANLWISLHVHPNECCLSSFKANASVFTLNWVNKEMAVFIEVVPPPTVSIFFCHLLNANSIIFKLTDKLAKIPFYIVFRHVFTSSLS